MVELEDASKPGRSRRSVEDGEEGNGLVLSPHLEKAEDAREVLERSPGDPAKNAKFVELTAVEVGLGMEGGLGKARRRNRGLAARCKANRRRTEQRNE